jgi:hypothetical protein
VGYKEGARLHADRALVRLGTKSNSLVVSLSPDPVHDDHTPLRFRELCIAAKLACKMSRWHRLMPPKML